MRIKTTIVTQSGRIFKKRCVKGINALTALDDEALIDSILEHHGFFRAVDNVQASVVEHDKLIVNDWVTIKERKPQL